MQLARIVLLALWLGAIGTTAARADMLYEYAGDALRFVQGYEPGSRITGNLVFSDAFIPGCLSCVGMQNATGGVVSYSFSDGHQTLTSSNSTGVFQFGFIDGRPTPGVLNSNGQIFFNGGWSVTITTPTSGIHTLYANDYTQVVWMGSPHPAGVVFSNGEPVGFDNPAISQGMLVSTDNAAVWGGSPGTWTSRAVAIPEPMSLLLVAAGLAGVVGARRFYRGRSE